jgi:predicted amidohydrolase
MIQIGSCLLDIVWEDRRANQARVRDVLAVAQPAPGALVVLPEMFASGFSLDVAKIADAPERGETQAFLAELAREHQVCLIAGLVTRAADGRGQNEAIVVDPRGQEIARYHKIHPFSYGGETKSYSAGRRIVTFDIGGFTVAPFVCYDLRFPEIFRHAVRQGASVFVVIANWPTKRVQHWTTLLQARAIENQAYVVGVNRAGRDPNVEYPGRSLIIDPRGEILADAGEREGAIAATLDLDSLQSYRREFPALADARFSLGARG